MVRRLLDPTADLLWRGSRPCDGGNLVGNGNGGVRG